MKQKHGDIFEVIVTIVILHSYLNETWHGLLWKLFSHSSGKLSINLIWFALESIFKLKKNILPCTRLMEGNGGSLYSLDKFFMLIWPGLTLFLGLLCSHFLQFWAGIYQHGLVYFGVNFPTVSPEWTLFFGLLWSQFSLTRKSKKATLRRS